MNKTIIININGIVFHIEEDAYEVLKSYMTEVKRHFAYSADSDEIITDIENRLAEMFNERLAAPNKQVIVLQDVEEVIGVMGSVNDFDYPMEEGGSTSNTTSTEKRLLRDPDDKHIAGVCSGLGYYLDIEAKWIRIIMVILAFTTGTTVILYAILWIVVPEARSRQEKMAMKGEPINLQSFKKNFETDGDSFNRNERMGSHSRTGDSIGSAISSIVNFIGRIVKIVVKTLGLFIAIAGSMALIGLIGALIFGIGFFKDGEAYNFILNTVSPRYQSEVIFSAFVLLSIPLIALISFAIRVIFNYRLISKTGAFAMLILWLTGFGMAVYYGSKIASEFKVDAAIEQEVPITKQGTYHLKLNRSRSLSRQDSLSLNLNQNFKGQIISDDDEGFDDNLDVDINIENSDSSTPILVKQYKARGKNLEAALKNAQSIAYTWIEQDSTLTFDKHFKINNQIPFRAQELNLIVKIPLGTRLLIDREVAQHIRNVNVWDCQTKEDDWSSPLDVIMTEGGLKCSKDLNKDNDQQDSTQVVH
ncbi:PspC domain-containing protein [Desertivirga arenae]|uniref:PspC domain-containing protein n=1 Tax=Desertivirga arenae TaxID=2810309 RepID=UPI001F61C4D4|nr:PspC domain-containing protein [Pedobacter sp. SYSU D00823]